MSIFSGIDALALEDLVERTRNRETLELYLREVAYAANFAPQLDIALATAQARAPHSYAAECALRILETEATEWAALSAEGEAWRPLAVEACARLDAAVAEEESAATTWLERLQVGLATLRTCYAALATSSHASMAAPRAVLQSLQFALLTLAYVAFARLRATDAACELRRAPLPPSRYPTPASDDAVDEGLGPALTVLGCVGVLPGLRALSLQARALTAHSRCLLSLAR